MMKTCNDQETTTTFRPRPRRAREPVEATRPSAWWQRLDLELSSARPSATPPVWEPTLTLERRLRRGASTWRRVGTALTVFAVAFLGAFGVF